MAISSFIRRIIGKRDTKKLVLGVVESLRIDEKQKDLYRQAVDILDQRQLEGLYVTLLESMKKFETAQVIADFSHQGAKTSGIRRKEAEAKVREEHSASILLDNI